jgi:transcriptional antiterminator
MAVHCPLCGQLVRHAHDGVFFSAKRAQIYDIVKRNEGISVGDLAKRLHMSEVTVRSHIYLINQQLEEAEVPWRLRGDGTGYVLSRHKK